MYVFMNISKRIDLAFINQGINDVAEYAPMYFQYYMG